MADTSRQGLKHALLTIWQLIRPYATTRDMGELTIPLIGKVRMQERFIGIGFFLLLAAINLFQVGLSVRLSYFSRDLYNALQEMNADAFWHQLLLVFVPLATIWVAVAILEIVIQYIFHIRWRKWMTLRYIDNWLAGNIHYKMRLAGVAADNPDQRIAEDINLFISNTRVLSLGLLSQVATLLSFAVILWSLSENFTVPGTEIAVPGLLLWVALVYAVLGTWLTHIIGRQLIPLNFAQQQYEADFRFSLARLREYGEQVALLSGEASEKQQLRGKFRHVVDNFMAILSREKKLTLFTASFFQASVVIPYLFTAPYLFLKKVTLGQMMQTVDSFSRVNGALTFFVGAYSTVAGYKAVVDRLSSFEHAIENARQLPQGPVAASQDAADKPLDAGGLVISGVDLTRPSGRQILSLPELTLNRGERALVAGRSGVGKSTLFRAIAGIWPFATGRIDLPEGQSVMLLPQRPYIPIGTLLTAVTYPSASDAYSREAVVDALEAVFLGYLVPYLDQEEWWGLTLSLGEQQRVAIARALLAKPDWLLLDEATAALDEPVEAAIYTLIRDRLPDTTVVSIGHRSTLNAFHDRRIELTETGIGSDIALNSN
ncbi:ABC transporter ATP-binding protein/permease [Pseudochelatococcus contaminans]|uniref:Putative ATP-binding cassette transporter n=1 Tax=Pseudochelatococcus contaminans TaxID=1538103 RepID=A0A7W5Z4N6_9HYPH|nr:ABC transporter ATP-binding protein/permease [Pseudochelatococcus contaminans]MBB3809491.1 putative ATP-binding cassette transporter [Pseudochelatococcus contaminans]